ncbi:MAG: glycosyltransferase family 2 protein [Rubrivivax sp.]|jgi:glycosyltransferase involved in cell wall biosynthesis|nr:glycosyltransferase family 2 protein [Rubrivivax sp.]
MRVSIVTPCRNEAGHVGPFLDSALAQRLPAGWTLQVVVADGASDDGTRAVLDARALADARLVVVDNPGRIVSTGLNRAVARADGEVVVRMDVHTRYADDYVAECVRALDRTGAACVGGAWRPVGEGGLQQAIARAFASRFGSGGAASRRVDHEGPVDTVYLGAWRRETLLAVGGFDESLVRNQDDELALRLVRAGAVVWQSASIRSWYVPRASLGALFRQFFQYGYWKVAVIRKHRLPASPRHLVPFGFVALLGLLAVAAPWSTGAAWALASVLAGYGIAAFGAAAQLARPWREPRQWLAIAAAFGCMHLGYGTGFGRALLDGLLQRRAPGASATRLTR